jgi:hypothetical protein
MAEGASLKKGARECGIDTDAIAHRAIPLGEPLPWDIIAADDRNLLEREYERAFGEYGSMNDTKFTNTPDRQD